MVKWLTSVNLSVPKVNPKQRHIPEQDNTIRPPDQKPSFYVRPNTSKLWSVGVPQGSNTGPLLALIPMRKYLNQLPSISYADDGIFYSKEDFEIKDMPEWGVHLHPTKSGWVKRDGKWLKPLNFLGLSWDGTSLSAVTKKGSRLIADSKHDAFSLLTDLLSGTYGTLYINTWETILKSKFGGTLISRMYSGDWNIEDVYKKIKLNLDERYINHDRKDINFFNASSYASYTLIKLFARDARKQGAKQ